MSTAHDYEIPPHEGAPAEAIDAAVGGRVVYLTRGGESVAAIVPANVAAAGAAAVEALEDTTDVRVGRAALADSEPRIPLDEVLAEYAADLEAYPEAEAP